MDNVAKEKQIVNFMISNYCKKVHGSSDLCPECRNLTVYSNNRLDRCPYGKDKPKCKKCTTPCYSKDNKQKIKMVMRHIGPRMLYLMPKEFITHLFNWPKS